MEKSGFQLGSRYRVIRPKTEAERNNLPGWVPLMDQYDGKILYCTDVFPNFAVLRVSPNETMGYGYRFEWVEPVDDKEDSLTFFRKVLGGF